MKPDVKKIIADIKATKGNRKYCNGLAGTLQDDNYVSSICKYVKTVTPERIDLLIEYAEKLETEVTDMAVQLANAESKCRELAAENVTVKECALDVMKHVYRSKTYLDSNRVVDAIQGLQCAIERKAGKTPSTDAFIAEVRASGVEMFALMFAEEAIKTNNITTGWRDKASRAASEYAEALREDAAQLRKGAKS